MTLVQLTGDAMTAMLYSLLSSIVFTWIRIHSRLVGRNNSHSFKKLSDVHKLVQTFLWGNAIVCSLLLSTLDQRWILRVIQMSMFASVLTVLLGLLLYHGTYICGSMDPSTPLLRGSRGGSRIGSASGGRASLPNMASIKYSPSGPSPSSPGPPASLSQGDLLMLDRARRRIIIVLVSACIVGCATLMLQTWSILQTIETKPLNCSKPRPPPSSVLTCSPFPILQCLAAATFFFYFRNSSSTSQTDRAPPAQGNSNFNYSGLPSASC